MSVAPFGDGRDNYMMEQKPNGWSEYKQLFLRGLDAQDELEKRVSQLEIGQAVMKSRLLAMVTIAFMVLEMVFRGAAANLLDVIFR